MYLDSIKWNHDEGEARASELHGAQAKAECIHTNRVATLGLSRRLDRP
jgi:hypothetical protein